jgi:DNA helicase-2/ATP-dependent DNA helicase PcrA
VIASPYVAYERAVRDSGGVDFDDLVVRALDRLTSDERLLARWRARTSTLLVDEVQDLDRTHLDLALVLAGPGRNLCAVGDDDHSLSESCTAGNGFEGWSRTRVERVPERPSAARNGLPA